MAMSRAMAVRPGHPPGGLSATSKRSPPLAGMLSPLAASGRPPSRSARAEVGCFYLARNAVYHGAKLLEYQDTSARPGVPPRRRGGRARRRGRDPALMPQVDAHAPRPRGSRGQDRPAHRALYVIHYAGFGTFVDGRRHGRRRGGAACPSSRTAAPPPPRAASLGSVGALGIFCFYKTLPVPNRGCPRRERSRHPRRRPVTRGRRPSSTLSHATRSLTSRARRSDSATRARRSREPRAAHAAAVRGATGVDPCPPAR